MLILPLLVVTTNGVIKKETKTNKSIRDFSTFSKFQKTKIAFESMNTVIKRLKF